MAAMNNPDSELKRTPLHAAHLRAGARMVPFGGWDMPVQYAGVKAEHQAVRQTAGVFDVSHMGEFRVTGPGAEAFLQRVTTNDVSKLKVGRAQYNWLPGEAYGLIDDIYIYRAGPEEFLLVVNASNIAKDWAHLQAQVSGYDAQLSDESEAWGLLAVQGPQAEQLLQPHLGSDLSARKKNSFFADELFGIPVWLARTGYTGEDGFEVFVAAEQAEAMWEQLLQAGLTPAGLGARDTLRLEAGFPLYGHEFSERIHPLSSSYTWVVKDKEHLGRAHIAAAPPQKLIGLALDKVPVREGYPVRLGGVAGGRGHQRQQQPHPGPPDCHGARGRRQCRGRRLRSGRARQSAPGAAGGAAVLQKSLSACRKAALGLSYTFTARIRENTNMNTPSELKYAASHEWLSDDGTVGISDFAQDQLGDVVYVELPEVGREVKAGESVAVVESVKTASDIYAPASGTITAVNDALSGIAGTRQRRLLRRGLAL